MDSQDSVRHENASAAFPFPHTAAVYAMSAIDAVAEAVRSAVAFAEHMRATHRARHS